MQNKSFAIYITGNQIDSSLAGKNGADSTLGLFGEGAGWFKDRFSFEMLDTYDRNSKVIFPPRDLGLVKDTLGWPSPMSSCVGPPLDKS